MSDEVIDTPFETENQIILRLPSTFATRLRDTLKCDINQNNRVKIELQDDLRNGVLYLDGWTLPFKVVDLPTIIECLKHFDGKTFYKTGDICQLFLCQEPVDHLVTEPMTQESKKKYSWPHGITPPLKNVKSKRFRKTVIKKNIDLYEIEKEVKRLLKTDSEAVKVRYELVDIEDEKSDLKLKLSTNSSKLMDIEEHELFGGALSSSDEDDDRIRLQKLDNSNSTITCSNTESSINEVPLTDVVDESLDSSVSLNIKKEMCEKEDISTDALEPEIASNDVKDTKELSNKLLQLSDEIKVLKAKIDIEESTVEAIDNIMLKQRIMNEISEMKLIETDLQHQHTEIANLLNATD